MEKKLFYTILSTKQILEYLIMLKKDHRYIMYLIILVIFFLYTISEYGSAITVTGHLNVTATVIRNCNAGGIVFPVDTQENCETMQKNTSNTLSF